jgi:putative phage-type endonuclease
MYDVIADRNADFQGWLDAHQRGIGASEIAAVMGRHRFMSRLKLWAIKTKRIFPDDLSDNEAVYWGNVLEGTVIEELQKRTGRDIEPSGTLVQSREHPWMLATVDGWASMGTVPVEVKTTGGVHIGDWADGAPEYNVWQLQQQMAVTGTDMAMTAVLVGTYGFRLLWQDVERDAEKIAEIISWGDWFWGYVERDEPPPIENDIAQADVADTLSKLWAEPKVAGTRIALPLEAAEWDVKLTDTKESIKALDEYKTMLENNIKITIADNEGGVLPDGDGFTYKAQARYNLTLAVGQGRPPVGETTSVLVTPTESTFRVLRRTKGN